LDPYQQLLRPIYKNQAFVPNAIGTYWGGKGTGKA